MTSLRVVAAVAMLAAAPSVAAADQVTGTVLDGSTFTPVEGATISIAGDETITATSDARGAYALDAPLGSVELRVRAPGYEPATETITVPEGGRADIVLILFRPGEVSEVIEVVEDAPPLPKAPGQQDLSRAELTRIPGSRGDPLTSIKNLPGVANADAGGNGPGILVIRGAAPEDSKVTIDGIEVPLLYHFFALQSILPAEFIDTIDFLPGGFGVAEGRATGGVINVATRDEVIEEPRGFAELSFINFAGFVETPLWKEQNLQLAAGLRRSAIDLLLPAVLPEDANLDFTTAPQYYDGQLRVDWRPSYRHRVSLLALGSYDLLAVLNDNIDPNEPLATGQWKNETSFSRVIATWRYSTDRVDNRLVAAAGTTGFQLSIGDERFLDIDERRVEVRDDLKVEIHPRIALRTGVEGRASLAHIRAVFPLPPAEGSPPTNFSNAPTLELDEDLDDPALAAYAAVDLQPTKTTTITGGVRVDYYRRIDEATVLPRMSVRQKLTRRASAHLSIGSYSRPLQQAEALQTNLEPELATQYVLGGDYDLGHGIEASASAFYTDRRQLVTQDARLAAMDPEAAFVNRGYGRSFGGEALLRVKRDDFFGWIAYTLSRSDRIDGPDQDRRLFDFDQTHVFIAVGSYRLGSWELGGRFTYSTGTPLTPVVDSLYLADVNIYIPVYGEPNSDRLGAAHQLDVRVDKKWTFDHWALSAYLDISNVYAHPRTLGFQYNFDWSQREAVKEIPILPAIGLRGSF